MIMFTTYRDHNVDEDPIAVLPCGHFYSISTLDGHVGMQSAYIKSRDQFIDTEPLFGGRNTISTKPPCCPDCRKIIHSVKRYGRILNFAELHVMERKHTTYSESKLKKYKLKFEISPKNVKLESLENLLKNILKGPMMRVYEACLKCEKSPFEGREPPARLRIQAMKLICEKHEQIIL